MKNQYRAIDLFAGIGGIRLGFQQAFGEEIEFVYANEIDTYACKTYETNFHQDPKGDITQIDPNNIPDFDILLAGFPCQTFSLAGNKRGFNDIRGTLFFYLAEIIRIKKPKAFFLENVRNLINHNKGRTFRIIRDVIEKDLGYKMYHKVLDAQDFGLPQRRKRVIIVGFKESSWFKFPDGSLDKPSIDGILEDSVPEKYYLSQKYLNCLKAHKTRHQKKGNGFGYQVIKKSGIANTIVCGGMGHERNLIQDKILKNSWSVKNQNFSLPNNEGIRKMTPLEWSRLQGFPNAFQFPCSMTRNYKLIANSVPIPVVRAVAWEMRKSLNKPIVIEVKPNNSVIERAILDFSYYLISNNLISKTRVKYITSLKKIVEASCIRIESFDHMLEKMDDYQLLEYINNKKVRFAQCYQISIDIEHTLENIMHFMLSQKSHGSIVSKYQKLGIIEALS